MEAQKEPYLTPLGGQRSLLEKVAAELGDDR